MRVGWDGGCPRLKKGKATASKRVGDGAVGTIARSATYAMEAAALGLGHLPEAARTEGVAGGGEGRKTKVGFWAAKSVRTVMATVWR